MKPFAQAIITGNHQHPNLNGIARFYVGAPRGIYIEIEVFGLPDSAQPGQGDFYGLHIHEFGDCSIPFDRTGNHYNPKQMSHPHHAGDLPPLLGNDGYAYSMFYTNRFTPTDVRNRSLVIHSAPDDFTTQPAGNSGDKIGCGVILETKNFPQPF